MVEPRIGLRLSKMMASGNQYAAAIVTASSGDMKVMIRETFQHPSIIGKVSFPQARATDVSRPYTRKGLLRKEMEDVEYGDDEVEDDEPEDGWTETSDDMDTHTPEVDIETDDEVFD